MKTRRGDKLCTLLWIPPTPPTALPATTCWVGKFSWQERGMVNGERPGGGVVCSGRLDGMTTAL